VSKRANPTATTARSGLKSSFPFLLGFVLFSTQAYAVRPLLLERTLSGHTDSILCVAFFPDNRTAVTGSRDKKVKIWDIPTGRVLRTLEAHTSYVFTVAVSRDGTRIASAGDDRAVHVWDVKSGKLIALLEGHTSVVVRLIFLPDGRILSAGHDSLRLWDVDQEKLIWKSDHGLSEMDTSADGKRAVVTRYSDGVHEVWDLTTRTMIQTLGNAGPMHPGLAISPDGARVVGEDNSRAGQTECWSVATGKTSPSIGTALGTERFTFSPDGSLLLRGTTAPAYGPATVFDSKTWKPLCELEEPANGREMTFSFAVSPTAFSPCTSISTCWLPTLNSS